MTMEWALIKSSVSAAASLLLLLFSSYLRWVVKKGLSGEVAFELKPK